MIGLGESAEELDRLFADLAGAGVDIVTVGQYLRPSREHLPVRRYYRPDEFESIAATARKAGIGVVVAGPYVRSSYRAAEAYAEAGALEAVRQSRRG
jgi:lipoic acid synthetase